MNRSTRSLPKDQLAFDIDGVVADIMTTFLALARETPLLFVTARDRRRPIERWLHRHLAPVPPSAIRVLATGDPDTKIHYLKDHGIHYFVEDRLDTCLQLADHGITPILFAQPWNRQPHPFIEVADWPELAGLLFEEGENLGEGD